METVYLETTVVGTIASRDHPDPVIRLRQSMTRRWWMNYRQLYDLRISDLVVVECSAGDPTAAAERLQLIDGVSLLAPNAQAEHLTNALLAGKAIPETEPRDAAHIALATVHEIDFILTWNFKHILNPHTQHLIRQVCTDHGYEVATICTPEQLTEADDEIESD